MNVCFSHGCTGPLDNQHAVNMTAITGKQDRRAMTQAPSVASVMSSGVGTAVGIGLRVHDHIV